MADDRLYFRQLLAGRDFATADPVARQMVNFVYLIGDRETGEAVVVDPAYGIKDLLGILDGSASGDVEVPRGELTPRGSTAPPRAAALVSPSARRRGA